MARFDKGWVKIHRRAILGDIGSNYLRGGLFGTLIVIANVQDSMVSWKGKPRKLCRGEVVTSLRELADLGEVDRTTVLRHLNYLVLRETISIEKSNRGILITIKNYDKYQSYDAEGPHQPQHQAQFSTHISPTHIKEGKKERRKELVIPPKPETPEELQKLVGKKNMASLLNDFSQELIEREFPEIVYYLQNNEDAKVSKYGLFVRNWIKRHIKFEENEMKKRLAQQNTFGIKAG